MCKTKPISRRGRAGRGTQGRGTRGNRAKRTQFPAGAGRPSLAPRPSGLAPAKPIVQNEANFLRYRVRRGLRDGGSSVDCAKRSQFPAVPGGTRPGGRRPWRAIVQNKPNLAPGVRKWARAGRPGASAGVDCAKRSQFRAGVVGGAIVRNKANLRGFGRRARASSLAPHSSGLPWVNCAKQSQFTPHRPGRTLAGRAASAAAAGTIVRNKPNCPRAM